MGSTFAGGAFASSLAGLPGGGFGALKGYNLPGFRLPFFNFPITQGPTQTSGAGISSPFLANGGPVSLDLGYDLPSARTHFDSGGSVEAIADQSGKTPPVTGGVPVHVHFDGKTYELSGAPEVAEQLVTDARARKMAQGGPLPSWYS